MRLSNWVEPSLPTRLRLSKLFVSPLMILLSFAQKARFAVLTWYIPVLLVIHKIDNFIYFTVR